MSSAAGSGEQAHPTTDSVAQGGDLGHGASTIRRKRRTNAGARDAERAHHRRGRAGLPRQVSSMSTTVLNGPAESTRPSTPTGRSDGDCSNATATGRNPVRPDQRRHPLGGWFDGRTTTSRMRSPKLLTSTAGTLARPGCRGPHLHREGRDHRSDRAGDERVECAARCAPRLLLGNLRVLHGQEGHCGLEEADARLSSWVIMTRPVSAPGRTSNGRCEGSSPTRMSPSKGQAVTPEADHRA